MHCFIIAILAQARSAAKAVLFGARALSRNGLGSSPLGFVSETANIANFPRMLCPGLALLQGFAVRAPRAFALIHSARLRGPVSSYASPPWGRKKKCSLLAFLDASQDAHRHARPWVGVLSPLYRPKDRPTISRVVRAFVVSSPPKELHILQSSRSAVPLQRQGHFLGSQRPSISYPPTSRIVSASPPPVAARYRGLAHSKVCEEGKIRRNKTHAAPRLVAVVTQRSALRPLVPYH